MKAIELTIAEYFLHPDTLRRSSRLTKRDYMLKGDENGQVGYILYNTFLAGLSNGMLTLGVESARWQTVTTKSRLNAIARAFGLPTIYQKNYAWKWSDGQEYTGPRIFDIETKRERQEVKAGQMLLNI